MLVPAISGDVDKWGSKCGSDPIYRYLPDLIDAILVNSVLPTIGRKLLARMMEGRTSSRVHVEVKDGQFDDAFD